MPTADTLRTLAATGMTRKAIAIHIGLSRDYTNELLQKFGIKTTGHLKPVGQDRPVRGCGKQPAKLMPSSRALGLVSIFSVGA